MEATDLTATLLRELRDGQVALRDELRESREQAERPFEVIETTLRDLAQQMVMLTRAVKVALD